jgi:hypothetical protein
MILMEPYLDAKEWKFYRSAIEGEKLELHGLDIWDNEWKNLGLYVSVTDPIYGEPHVMGVYEIANDRITVKFATGEFSNMVWGIYLPV